jgi:hypothetical protein
MQWIDTNGRVTIYVQIILYLIGVYVYPLVGLVYHFVHNLEIHGFTLRLYGIAFPILGLSSGFVLKMIETIAIGNQTRFDRYLFKCVAAELLVLFITAYLDMSGWFRVGDGGFLRLFYKIHFNHYTIIILYIPFLVHLLGSLCLEYWHTPKHHFESDILDN